MYDTHVPHEYAAAKSTKRARAQTIMITVLMTGLVQLLFTLQLNCALVILLYTAIFIAIRDISLSYRDTNVHGNRRSSTGIDRNIQEVIY